MDLNFTSEHIGTFLLAAIPAVANTLLTLYVFFKLPKRPITQVFGFVLLTSAGWQWAAALMRISGDMQTASFFDNVVTPLGLFTGPTIFHFALLLKDPERKSRFRIPVLVVAYGLMAVMAMMYPEINTPETYEYTKLWGWINVRADFYFYITLGLYIQLLLFLGTGIYLWEAFRSKPGSHRRIQLLLIGISLAIVITQTMITEVVFPLILELEPFTITSVTMVLFSVCTFIALTRYRLFQGLNDFSKRDLLSQISDIVLVIDSDLHLSYINRAGLSRLGYTEEQIDGLHIARILECGKVDKDSEFLQHLEASTLANQHCYLHASNGTLIPVLIGSAAVQTPGRNLGYVISCRDITDIEAAREELQKSEQRFKKMIERSQDAVALVNERGHITYVTQAIANILGYQPEEVLNRNFLEMLHPDSREAAISVFQSNLATPGSPDVESVYKALHKDGSTVFIEAAGTNYLEDLEIQGLVTVFRNVTQRHYTQQERERSLALFKSLINAVNTGIIVEDQNREIFAANQTYCDFFNMATPPDSLIGKHRLTAAEQSSHLVKESETFVQRIVEISERRNPVLNEEIEFVDGRIFRRDYFPIWTETGEFMGHLWIYADVTKRKQIEQELTRQNEELTKANSELDKFVYSASHDIRSPLMSILGLVNLASQETDDPGLQQYIEMIGDRVRKLDEFTLEIIHYSRNARTEVVEEEVHVKDLLDEIVESLRYQETAQSIDFRVEVSPDLMITTDRSRLQVVLSNIVSNAIKYQRNIDRPAVTVSASRIGNHIEFAVEDNGEGIPADKLEKVFDMFTRFSEQSKGSGLGLYIVREIVEKLNGKIDVASTAGEGSTFKVVLPEKTERILSLAVENVDTRMKRQQSA